MQKQPVHWFVIRATVRYVLKLRGAKRYPLKKNDTPKKQNDTPKVDDSIALDVNDTPKTCMKGMIGGISACMSATAVLFLVYYTDGKYSEYSRI